MCARKPLNRLPVPAFVGQAGIFIYLFHPLFIWLLAKLVRSSLPLEARLILYWIGGLGGSILVAALWRWGKMLVGLAYRLFVPVQWRRGGWGRVRRLRTLAADNAERGLVGGGTTEGSRGNNAASMGVPAFGGAGAAAVGSSCEADESEREHETCVTPGPRLSSPVLLSGTLASRRELPPAV